MKQIIEQARRLAIPSKKLQQDKTKVAKLAFNLVRKQVTKYSQITGVEFGGSYVKGTWLPNKADVDIFIKFEKSTPDKKFVEISKKIGFDSMTKFMLESLTGPMKDEVRLLKNFLSSNKIYGSEIAKQGISGYVTEVLILHYGSFQDVIKAIAKLKKKQNFAKQSKQSDTSIIIIDPI